MIDDGRGARPLATWVAASSGDHLPEDRLAASDLDELERAHLSVCARCRVEARRMRAFLADLPPPADSASESVAEPPIAGRYRIESVVGRGAFGTVYAVKHLELGSMHALKLLAAVEPRLAERLRREGALQAMLSHPNVVRVTDAVEVAGRPGLVMELVSGPTLAEALATGQLATWRERREVAEGIARGLRAAHERGWLHRDLKPANILLARDDEGHWVPKIADFGLARLVGAASPTRTGAILGTPAYMAPEQLVDPRTVDASADVFALGAVLYELATGHRAFSGDDLAAIQRAIREERFRPPRELAPDLPEAFEAAILGCLRADPKERLPDCGAVLAVLAGEPVRRPRRWIPWAAGLLALFIASGLPFHGQTPPTTAAPPPLPVAVPTLPPVAPPVAPAAPAPPPKPAAIAAPPRPVPVAVAEPVSAPPPPPPTPPPAPVVPGRVLVVGDVAVELRQGDRAFSPGTLDAGDYEVWADLGRGTARQANLTLAPGETALIRCNRMLLTCRVER